MRSDYHQPVLLNESVEWLVFNNSGRYIDATLGGGGHSAAILKQLDEQGRLDSFDRDRDAIEEAGARLQGDSRLTLHHRPFADMVDLFSEKSISGVLMDLGISSHQVDEASRGFSFRRSERVDLRMSQSDEIDATEWIRQNGWERVARALSKNADLYPVKKLALSLFSAVEEEGELTMSRLMEIVGSYSKGSHADDLAARVLQALRMEVNDELGQLERALDAVHSLLVAGGRLVVLSYHSVEDRLVKQKAKEWMRDCLCAPELPLCLCGGHQATFRSLLKTPLTPSEEEIKENPRSRSAKLRVYERV